MKWAMEHNCFMCENKCYVINLFVLHNVCFCILLTETRFITISHMRMLKKLFPSRLTGLGHRVIIKDHDQD